ncbi:MAG: helix-turn-helix transcriptional regulator [Rhodanobacteraceae bacterium]|nr:helix-turn-helix transcriptional regulator [Rhodanobacteraceae bacterium]
MTRSTHYPHYLAFLELLRESRKATGVTQVELAERLGNRQVFVSKIERGDRRLDVVDLIEYCNASGIDVVKFIKQLVPVLAEIPTPKLGKLAVHKPKKKKPAKKPIVPRR